MWPVHFSIYPLCNTTWYQLQTAYLFCYKFFCIFTFSFSYVHVVLGLLNNASSAANPSTITSAAPGLSFGTQPAAAPAGGTALGGGFSFGTSLLGADNQKKTVSFNVAGSAANTPASSTTQAAAPTLSTLLGGSTASTSSLPGIYHIGFLVCNHY